MFQRRRIQIQTMLRPHPVTFASNAALRRKDGARVIQLPSGNMPTISECACWLI